MNMEYWEEVTNFHERVSAGKPSGVEGLKAVNYLRELFVNINCKQLPQDHPLYHKLFSGGESNYHWLIQFSKKLNKISTIPGFQQISGRLRDPKEYRTLLNEIEVALYFILEGMDVLFAVESEKKTPDLLVTHGGLTFRVEVSTLNPPDTEDYVHTFWSQLDMLRRRKKIIMGGLFTKVPSPRKFKEIIAKVDTSIDKMLETQKSDKLNFQGICTIYVAPPDKIGDIPEDFRNGFEWVLPTRKSLGEKIKNKIKSKSEQLFNYNESTLLILYTRMINKDVVIQEFQKKTNDIEEIISSYPKLLGLVLLVPFLSVETVHAITINSMKKKTHGTRVLIEKEIGAYPYESCLIWKKIHADRFFPQDIENAFENYLENLQTKLDVLS